MRHSYGDSAARIKFSLVSLLVYIIKSSRYLLGREKSFVHEIILRLQCYMNFPLSGPHIPFWAAKRADKSFNMSLSIGDELVKTRRQFNLFLWHGLSETVEIY